MPCYAQFSDTGGHWWNVWCSSAPVVEVPLGSWHLLARICHPDLWGCAVLHRQIHGGNLATGQFSLLIRHMEIRMKPVEAIDSIALESLENHSFGSFDVTISPRKIQKE